MKYRLKPVDVEAITFEELVEIGRKKCGPHLHDGMPWSFHYMGEPITHENDDCYLIPTPGGTMKFHRGDFLVASRSTLYPIKRDVFLANYDPVRG